MIQFLQRRESFWNTEKENEISSLVTMQFILHPLWEISNSFHFDEESIQLIRSILLEVSEKNLLEQNFLREVRTKIKTNFFRINDSNEK